MNIQPFVQFLHLHPHWVGIITYFIVFMEAMAVIGVVVPGSITMSAIGALIGANVIPAGTTFGWAILGAITGDYLSYLLGAHYKNKLHKIWPFNKHPKWLEKSEVFFAKHGGKSVFLGRFIGPMRAMVPMVAGMLKMPRKKFLLAAIPSAALWAVGYMLPGVVLGALASELPPKLATQFILGGLGILIIVWLLFWFIHHFSRRIFRFLDGYVLRLWLFFKSHKTLNWFAKLLEDPREPDNHQQLSLVILSFIVLCLFLLVFVNVASHGILTTFNVPLYNFLTSFRFPLLDYIMVIITSSGEVITLLFTGGLFLLWLLYKRYWYVAVHWGMLMLVMFGAVVDFKSLIFSPRPGGPLNFQHTSSFPSGHTAMSAATFGFWAVMIAREMQDTSKRWIPYVVASTYTFLVAFSRLYLGAHWLTDVVGSFLLGVFFVVIFAISYRRRHSLHLDLKKCIIASLAAFVIATTSYCLLKLPKQLDNYKLHWPKQTVVLQDLRHNTEASIPLYRVNRLGKPVQAFNLQWVGSLDYIQKNLAEQGWELQPVRLNLSGAIRYLVGNSAISHLSLLPQLYHNKLPVLLMTKTTNNENAFLVLRLWQSDIKIAGTDQQLWLGAIDYHILGPKVLNIIRKNGKTKFIGATDIFANYLHKHDFRWHEFEFPYEKQPEEMLYLNWDGKVLFVENAGK